LIAQDQLLGSALKECLLLSEEAFKILELMMKYLTLQDTKASTLFPTLSL